MMKKLSLDEIVKKHIESDKIIESVLMTTDYKTINREGKKQMQLVAPLKDDLILAEQVYKILLQEESVVTRSHAAAECLRIGIFIDEAEKTLEELSQRKDIGITSFNCEMTLKVWRGEIPGKTL